MNGSTENRASDAFEKSDKSEIAYNLGTARRMIPLVRRIVDDVVRLRRQLAVLSPEQSRLDRERRTLAWPQRQRRYELHEDLGSLEHEYRDALAELEVLGVALLVPSEGLVGLPTVVNGRIALFSWKPGEETLRFWHFPGESIRRPIPASWKEFGEIRTQVKA